MRDRRGQEGIGVALVGVGYWGPNLVRLLRDNPRSHLRWVIDRDEDRLGRVEARFGYLPITTSYDAALGDPSVRAVVVATPTATHHTLAKQALEAGKHVLVEKPLAASAEDGRELVDLAAERGLTLMVGHVFLFDAAVLYVKRLIDEGRLGGVQYVSMVRTNLGPFRHDVNAAWDLAAHDVSIVNHWLGAVPEQVSATAESWINPGIEDLAFVTLRYPGNVLAHLHCSWLNPRKVRDYTIVGEKQMVTVDNVSLDEPVRIYDKTVVEPEEEVIDSFVAFRSSIREGDMVVPKIHIAEPLRDEVEHFLACVESGDEPRASAGVGLDVVRVLDAVGRSIERGGAPVEVA